MTPEVYFYGPDSCPENTMTTDHFVLGSGEEATVELDLACMPNPLMKFYYFVYVTTKNRSRQSDKKDKLNLTIEAGGSVFTADSFMMVDLPSGPVTVKVRNGHPGKDQKLRMRASAY
jgi:hypothetical protein